MTEYSNLTTITKRLDLEPITKIPRRAGYIGVNFLYLVLYY
jgi:hypothetical protein